MAKTQTFRTVNDVLAASPPSHSGKDYYVFLKHESVSYLYARISRPDKDGNIRRDWQAHYKEQTATGRKDMKPNLGFVTAYKDEPAMTLADAIAAASTLISAGQKPYEGLQPMTMKQACEIFLKRLDSPASDLADGTKDKYRNSIQRYLLPLGDKTLQEMKEPFWRQFKDELLMGTSSLSNAPLAIATVQGIFSAVTRLYRVGHEARAIFGEASDWDPGRVIMKESPPANRKTGHIKLANIGRAWQAADALVAPGWRDLFRLFLLTGLRDSLLKDLKWSNVDFRNERLLFDKLAKGTKRQRKALSHDERKGKIEIPLSKYAIGILVKRKMFAPPEHVNPYVFYAASGSKTRNGSQRLGRSDKSWARIANAIKQHFTRHDLRRTFAGLGCTGAPDSVAHVSMLLMHTNKLIANTLNVPEITLQYAQQQVTGMRRVTNIVTQMVLELAGEVPKTALTSDIPTLVFDPGIAQELHREEIAYIRQSRTSNIDRDNLIEHDDDDDVFNEAVFDDDDDLDD